MLILSRRAVEELLDLDRLVDAVADAMVDAATGRASLPPRIAALVPGVGGLLGAMPAHLPSAHILEAKLVSLFPGNARRNLPTHQAAIVVFDPDTGSPVALMDGTYVTETRTAAGSALSVRLLARAEVGALAVLGTGVQARAHLRAVTRVRPPTAVRVAGRDRAKAQALAAWAAGALGLPAEAVGSFARAVEGADVVCACTHSPEPVVRREWLASGAHVTSVGVSPEGGEVDPEIVREALVVVETRAAVLAAFPSGSNDIRGPVERGLVRAEDLVEIGRVVSGGHPGRTAPDQLTLYKSVGIGAQDAAAAALVLAEARERGAGVEVEL